MGNLARPGYGGTTDGMWPYSYDTCDIGTLPNQTLNGELQLKYHALGRLHSETQHRVSTYSTTL
jgi:beta-glucanase (GH16 family)